MAFSVGERKFSSFTVNDSVVPVLETKREARRRLLEKDFPCNLAKGGESFDDSQA
jgi:hypothetical protein